MGKIKKLFEKIFGADVNLRTVVSLASFATGLLFTVLTGLAINKFIYANDSHSHL